VSRADGPIDGDDYGALVEAGVGSSSHGDLVKRARAGIRTEEVVMEGASHRGVRRCAATSAYDRGQNEQNADCEDPCHAFPPPLARLPAPTGVRGLEKTARA